MRLIDADAFIEMMEEKCDYTASLDEWVLKVCRGGIKKMPTIETQSKMGKWIKPTGMMPPEYMGVYRCSECGEIAMRDWKRHYQTLTNYCPNCGAMMLMEGEEHV